MTTADAEHITEAVTDRIRRHPFRWKVTVITATQSGVRELHDSTIVNAADQFVAAVTALAVEFDYLRPPGRWSELHIKVEPEIPCDRKPLTADDVAGTTSTS